MRHPIRFRILAGSVVIACASIVSGCWWGRREPRHDDRVVVVHEDRHEAPREVKVEHVDEHPR